MFWNVYQARQKINAKFLRLEYKNGQYYITGSGCGFNRFYVIHASSSAKQLRFGKQSYCNDLCYKLAILRDNTIRKHTFVK